MNVFASAEEYAEWVVKLSRRYTVRLEAIPIVARDEVLRAAGAWPGGIEVRAERSEELTGGSDTSHVSTLRCELQAAVDPMFNVRSDNRVTGRKEALARVRKFVDQLESDPDARSKLGCPTEFVLKLPVRKKAEMRELMELLEPLDHDLKNVWLSAVETALGHMQGTLPAPTQATHSCKVTESKESEVTSLVSRLRCDLKAARHSLFTADANKRATKRKGALACIQKFFVQLEDDLEAWEELERPTQFVLLLPNRKKARLRALMELLGSDVKYVWWSAVEAALAQIVRSQLDAVRKKKRKKRNALLSRERDNALADAYRSLVRLWRSQTRRETIIIKPRLDGERVSVQVDTLVGPRIAPVFDPFGGPCGPSGIDHHVRRPLLSLAESFRLELPTISQFGTNPVSSCFAVDSWRSDDEIVFDRRFDAAIGPMNACSHEPGFSSEVIDVPVYGYTISDDSDNDAVPGLSSALSDWSGSESECDDNHGSFMHLRGIFSSGDSDESAGTAS